MYYVFLNTNNTLTKCINIMKPSYQTSLFHFNKDFFMFHRIYLHFVTRLSNLILSTFKYFLTSSKAVRLQMTFRLTLKVSD